MLKKLWNSFDGKKTFTGLALIGAGLAMFSFPLTASYATEILIAGISTTVAGITHKVIKSKGKKNEN